MMSRTFMAARATASIPTQSRETDMQIQKMLCCFVVVALASPTGTSAWALDVKPGLWEIAIEGSAEPHHVCYTQEALNADFAKVPNPPGVECANEIKESGATRMVAHTSCTGNFAIEGDTTVQVLSPESMSMQSTSVMTFGGNQQAIDASAAYRWLRSDCGDVKPFDPNKIFE
jgi:hypothetical protein